MTPFQRVRALCLALPDTFEKIGHGAPVLWAKKKPFVMMADNHHNDGRHAVWVRATHDAQDLFVQSDAKRFFIPPYVGVQGWVGIRLEGHPPWGTIEDILRDAHRLAVTKPAPRVRRRQLAIAPTRGR